jgi:hypothetical protein
VGASYTPGTLGVRRLLSVGANAYSHSYRISRFDKLS